MRIRPRFPLVTLLPFAVVLALDGCGGNVLEEAPDGIQGTWITDAAAYQGRGFTIEADRVTLLRGDEGPVTHVFERIEFVEQGEQLRYKFHHLNVSGEMDVLEVVRRDVNDEFVRLGNLPRVHWYRGSTGVAGT